MCKRRLMGSSTRADRGYKKKIVSAKSKCQSILKFTEKVPVRILITQ